jgi:hypothetical protein
MMQAKVKAMSQVKLPVEQSRLRHAQQQNLIHAFRRHESNVLEKLNQIYAVFNGDSEDVPQDVEYVMFDKVGAGGYGTVHTGLYQHRLVCCKVCSCCAHM